MADSQQQLEKAIRSLRRYRVLFLLSQTIYSLALLLFCTFPFAYYFYMDWLMKNLSRIETIYVNQHMAYYVNGIIFGIMAVLVIGSVIAANTSRKRHTLYSRILKILASTLPGELNTAAPIAPSSLRQSYLFPRLNKSKKENFFSVSFGSLAGAIDGVPVRFGDITLNSNGMPRSIIGKIMMAIAPFNFLYMGWAVLYSLLRGRNGEMVEGKGLFFIARFPESVKGKTVIVPDRFERHGGFLARVLQNMNMNRDDLVHLENPDFENAFVTYTTDQVEARRIITLPMMERMVELQKKREDILVSFRGKHMYVFLPSHKGFFDEAFAKSRNAEEAQELLVEQLNFCTDLLKAIGIEHLNRTSPGKEIDDSLVNPTASYPKKSQLAKWWKRVNDSWLPSLAVLLVLGMWIYYGVEKQSSFAQLKTQGTITTARVTDVTEKADEEANYQIELTKLPKTDNNAFSGREIEIDESDFIRKKDFKAVTVGKVTDITYIPESNSLYDIFESRVTLTSALEQERLSWGKQPLIPAGILILCIIIFVYKRINKENTD